jgi:transcriptional regulator with XRE-family HTH domain
MFLNLSGQIEGQLREAYDCQFQAGKATQASLAKKLGIDRSTVHRRLTGHTNMTTETIADMVWGLGYAINVEIFDPSKDYARRNSFFCQGEPLVPAPKDPAAPKSELSPALEDLLKKNPMAVGMT